MSPSTPDSRPTHAPPPPPANPPLPSLTPSKADSLAEALVTARPRHEIAAEHNLSLAQLAALARTPVLTERISAINDLFTLQDAAIKREQIDRLREIANTSESPVESRRAAMAILTHISPSRQARRMTAESPKPSAVNDPTTEAARGSAPGSGVSASYKTLEDAASADDHPPTSSPTPPPAPRQPCPPPEPPPCADADRLLAHQLKRFRDARPTSGKTGFVALYDYCSHRIKIGGEPRAHFTRRLENSLLHCFLDHPWEQLPADKSERINRTPGPDVPDHRPLQTAIARITINRDPNPVCVRFLLHLEQPYPRYDPNWAIEDIVLESG